MPYELIPMSCAAVAALVFAVWAGRRGSGARVVAGTALIFFAALTLGGSMALHSGEILYNAVNGIEVGIETRHPNAPQANILGFKYDFRFYSLQLFGGVLMFWSVRLALYATHIARGSATASARAWKDIAYITLFVAPLVPMHIFAVATVVTMAVAALGQWIARVRPSRDTVPAYALPAEG